MYLLSILSGECVTSLVLSCGSNNLNNRWTSLTAQFYLASKRKYIPEVVRAGRPKRREEKRGQRPSFGSSFHMFSLLPLSLPMYRASQEGCLFHLRLSLWSSDLPLVYFHGFFPSLSFNHHHSGLLFPILTAQHLPLKKWEGPILGEQGH